MNKVTHTGRIFYSGGIAIPEIDVEPCYRLSQYGKGEPITCQCTTCKAKNQTPEEAKAAMDKFYLSIYKD